MLLDVGVLPGGLLQMVQLFAQRLQAFLVTFGLQTLFVHFDEHLQVKLVVFAADRTGWIERCFVLEE